MQRENPDLIIELERNGRENLVRWYKEPKLPLYEEERGCRIDFPAEWGIVTIEEK